MRRFPTYTMRHTVAYVGSYPPERSSTAMFTMDLVNATDLIGWQSIVVAACPDKQTALGPWDDHKVAATVVPDDSASFATAAQVIQRSEIDAVCIHHSPGTYGDCAAENLPLFARMVECPVVVTIHTIDPAPETNTLRCLQALEPCSSAFVTMAQAGVPLLADVYGIPRDKIRYIPHGTPNFAFSRANKLAAKEWFGLEGRTVLSTFGLLSPKKGIDDMIAALPDVVRDHPEAILLILGVTHPRILKTEGEVYRRHLQGMARQLGVAQHIRFVDEYLDLRRLIDYLSATDIYIHAEHADPHKITSGALAYAFAAGALVISTPTPYAHELLAHRRGYLFPFRDSQALAQRICQVLDEPHEADAVRQRAYAYGRGMTWEDVGVKYVELFNHLIHHFTLAHTDDPSAPKPPRGLPSTILWEHARMNSTGDVE